MKTARSWRAIVPSTHLAREGAGQSPSDCWPHSAAWLRGRSRRARNNPSPCGGLACLPISQQRTRKGAPVPRRFYTEALLQGLSELGWHEGRTLQIDIPWGADDADTSQAQANELLALAPDVIFATTTSKVQVLRRVSRSVPIVFAGVPDSVGGGLVATLARPRDNITGFALPEYGISVKWLELLKEIAPRAARVGVLSGFGATPGIGQLAALQAVAPSMRADLTPLVVSDAGEIEATVRAFSSAPNRGLIITVDLLEAPVRRSRGFS